MHEPYGSWLLSESPPPPEQQARLAAHLETCPTCRGLAAAWAQVAAGLAALPESEPPPGFLARWEARAARHRRRTILALALTTAFGSLLLGALVLFWLPTQALTWLQGLLTHALRSPWPNWVTLPWALLRLTPKPLLALAGVLWGLGALSLPLLWGQALQCAWGMRPCPRPIAPLFSSR